MKSDLDKWQFKATHIQSPRNRTYTTTSTENSPRNQPYCNPV